MEFVKGPDFPTGASIVGRNTVRQAYSTGKGRIRVRARYEVERNEADADRIIIGELPYQQNKSRLVERIADDVNDGRLEGIRDLRDESDRNGIRVVIELKRNANTDVIENRLLESHLERTFGVINLALVDGQPKVLTLKEMLREYIEHRRVVVTRRSEHDLQEAEDRAHILEGRLKALDNVEDVVETIRNSEDRDAARDALEARFDFTEPQSEHIVRMQLGSLTSLERTEIEEEYEDVQATIERLEEILGSESELMGVIKDELRDIREQYADERRTDFVEDTGEVTDEDLIPEEQVLVTLSEGDYIKRTPVDTFKAQHRGGKGIIGTELKEGDRVSTVFTASTHDYLLCFTNQGQVYQLKTYQIPEQGRTARGKSAVNLLDLDDDEELTAVLNTNDFGDDEFLTMITRNGKVKRTPAQEYEDVLSTGIIAIRLEESDELADVEITDGQSDLVIASEHGMAIRFDETEARATARATKGVNGIKLREGDRAVSLVATHEGDDRSLFTVTEHGYGKRTLLSEYRPQSRYGYGLMDIKTDERNGRVVAAMAVTEDDHVIAMSAAGQILRTVASEVSTVGRNTKGVRIMDLEAGDVVASTDVFTPRGADEEPGE
jgi:DNA gyrase subunit A